MTIKTRGRSQYIKQTKMRELQEKIKMTPRTQNAGRTTQSERPIAKQRVTSKTKGRKTGNQKENIEYCIKYFNKTSPVQH
jgi:hypothetical protein